MNLANSFVHITTLTTTVIKTGAGELHTVVIGTKGATASSLTLYNNTVGSGAVIAVIDVTTGVGSIEFDCAFSIGLTAVSAGGTAGDYTITYR